MIELRNVNKSFKVSKRNAGFVEAAKALFNRTYEVVEALKDISFKISEGEIVGYIGPNGAGKSSTVKIMSGILTPENGYCQINGIVPWKNRKEHVKKIGVVFGQRSQLWWDVPVIDSFELLKNIYDIPQNIYKNNLEELTEQLNLKEILKTPVRQLSLGQRMRCEIAASLIHSPQILFLDEPTIGLDAVSKIAVREFIKKINREKNTTVILTTHDMQDIEALTNRIILIGKGRILLDGNLQDLKKKYSKYKDIIIDFTGESLNLCNGLKFKESYKGRATIEVDTDIIDVSSAISFLSQQIVVNDISILGASIEEIVVNLYEEYHI